MYYWFIEIELIASSTITSCLTLTLSVCICLICKVHHSCFVLNPRQCFRLLLGTILNIKSPTDITWWKMWHLRGHEKGYCFMRVETRRQNAYYLTSVGNMHVGLVKFFTVLHCPQKTAKVLKVMGFSDSWIHEYGILKYGLIVHFSIHILCSYYCFFS